jgi:hypothetical protein
MRSVWQLWDTLYPGHTVMVNTYPGHRWHVRVGGDLQRSLTWTVEKGRATQRFVVTAEALLRSAGSKDEVQDAAE